MISLQVSLFEVFECPSLPKLFPYQQTHKEAQAFTSSSGILHSGIAASSFSIGLYSAKLNIMPFYSTHTRVTYCQLAILCNYNMKECLTGFSCEMLFFIL